MNAWCAFSALALRPQRVTIQFETGGGGGGRGTSGGVARAAIPAQILREKLGGLPPRRGHSRAAVRLAVAGFLNRPVTSHQV